MKRLGILGSSNDAVILDLIDAIKHRLLPAEIAVVLSDNSNAPILESAKKFGYLSTFVDPDDLAVDVYEKQMLDKLEEASVELVVLLNYQRMLSQSFIARWGDNIINVHPSLLPAFAGKNSDEIHRAILDEKLKETGCTVYSVTDKVGEGPILIQEKCLVLPTDNLERLKARVQALESVALISAINKMIKAPAR